jgi:ankyrin repeat protein
MKAADHGNVEVVQQLINAGADVNARDEEGETALDKAADERNLRAVQVLRAAGAR